MTDAATDTDLRGDDRTEAFRQEIGRVRVPGSTVARERMFARLGELLLVLGIVLGIVAYVLSTGTDIDAQQRDSIVLALIGVTVSIAGLALYLRYSLGALLRLWLARLVAERE